MSGGEDYTEQLLIPEKFAMRLEISDELLMDYGLIPDTRPPRPPVPWRTRLRWRWHGTRGRLAERAYKLIAGHEVPEPDD